MILDTCSTYTYHVGGSLGVREPSYVERQADQDLYEALLNGQFCYVFNARQTGKSSLRVRMRHRLKQSGFACAAIDLTSIGSERVTPQQWYKGVASELLRGFDLLGKVNFKAWWEEQSDLSPIQILCRFIEEVLLTQIGDKKLFIFIDEVDSILSSGFPLDDFFALIRFFYNQRSQDSKYHRLTFALFGVVTPSDLIRDRNRTPFNIGKAIELTGFRLEEAWPLLEGFTSRFNHPRKILDEILTWTGGQPFLTQKLCHMVVKADDKNFTLDSTSLNAPDQTASWIAALLQSEIIEKWESQDDPEHLRTIRDRLLKNPQRSGRLLGVYETILQHGSIPADDSVEQVELQLSGLVVKQNRKLVVLNQIYASVFNQSWLDKQFAKLRPYAEVLAAWVRSDRQDTSRLLRGQALLDAQTWADARSLSDLDYQFLAASQTLESQALQQAEMARTQAAEARTQAAEVKLAKQKETSKWQQFALGTLSVAFATTTGLAVTAYLQYRRALTNEIQAIVTTSKESFASDHILEALVKALQARRKLDRLAVVPVELSAQTNAAIRQAAFRIKEYNYLSGHSGAIYDVAFSPDDQLIASASRDDTIKLWRPDGSLVKTLNDHGDQVRSVSFSPDGKLIASASQDGTVKLWRPDGAFVEMLDEHSAGVNSAVFSPDGEIIASGSDDNTIKLWQRDSGCQNCFRAYKTLRGHDDHIRSVAFSSDGELIASASEDSTIKLWRPDGTLLKTLEGHENAVNRVAFSPDGGVLASASNDATIRFWSRDGLLLETFKLHESGVRGIAFSPDGQTLASSANDGSIKLWRLDGTVLSILAKRGGTVRSVVFSRDNNGSLVLASANEDGAIHLWRPDSSLLKTIAGHQDEIEAVAFSPDGTLLATSSDDRLAKLWRIDGALETTFREHSDQVEDVDFSPNGQLVVSASGDNTVKLWDLNGEAVLSLEGVDGHTTEVEGVAFSPDGQLIASASDDKTIKLWRLDGTLIETLEGHTARVQEVVFSPDGQLVASASGDGSVKLWGRDGTFFKSLEAHEGGAEAIAFNIDGKLIASAGEDKTVKLWRVDGTLIHVFEGHRDRVRTVSFGHYSDQEILASAGGDRAIKLWHLDGSLLTTLHGHTGGVNGLDFSSDNRYIASVGDDGQLILWDLTQVLSLERVIAYGCQWIKDYLRTSIALEERDRHLCDDIVQGETVSPEWPQLPERG